jgi:hypothetical protein
VIGWEYKFSKPHKILILSLSFSLSRLFSQNCSLLSPQEHSYVLHLLTIFRRGMHYLARWLAGRSGGATASDLKGPPFIIFCSFSFFPSPLLIPTLKIFTIQVVNLRSKKRKKEYLFSFFDSIYGGVWIGFDVCVGLYYCWFVVCGFNFGCVGRE